MSDIVTTARTAREALARGLNALQADPSVAAALQDLAAPIAQAMGALHAIERSGGASLVPNADVALTHTRAALAQLQSRGSGPPAVTQAMEAVASSLSVVHSLSKEAASKGGGIGAFPAPQAAAPAQNIGYAPTVVANANEVPASRAAPRPASAGSAAGPPSAGPQPQPAKASSLNPPPAPMPAGEVQHVNADLGAHSPTNFYKGLSGNDVIDHGGLFIATYMIPKIGTTVRLKVALPGGYEFEANGVVRWAREQSDGSDAPPGFGAQFTQITPEARQLVYRYVRNREPLFHDDL